MLVLWGIGYGSYNEESLKVKYKKEFAALDAGLKQYLNDKKMELFVSQDSIATDYFRYHKYLEYDKVLEGKFLAIIRDDNDGETKLEYRLNEELRNHNQYTLSPNSLDYVVVLFPRWDTDYYRGGGSFSSTTEMATAYVVDYKADTIVKIREFDTDKNPFAIQVNKRAISHNEKHNLKGEELYNGVMNPGQYH